MHATWINSLTGTIVVLLGVSCARQAPIPRSPAPEVLRPVTTAPAARLPRLDWTERSDWLNVKTAGTPAAVGDGVADDTVALQAALDQAVARSQVVYLPPGVYRITASLMYRNVLGGALIGHGRDTRIIWDGSDGGRMFISNGASRTRYVGLVWDGQGRADIGIDHDSRTRFETRVRHQHEAFLNFRVAGTRVGAGVSPVAAGERKLESAEMLYENCLYAGNANGALFQQWNDYDNTFDGCEFLDNTIGVNVTVGNAYIRNSRFERSADTDILLHAHSHSVRRCVSQGSHRFIRTTTGSSGHSPINVQDCLVDGWRDPAGAIQLGLRGPLLVFDCEFRQPPTNAAPIQLRTAHRHAQLGVVSQNRVPAGLPVTAIPGANPHGSRVIDVPARARGGALTDPRVSFLKSTVAVPRRVFDARTEFGAKADGQTDDTVAVQAAIDAAAAAGSGALAYLPTGKYRLTRPLRMTGRGYAVGGSGFNSVLVWGGPPADTEPMLAIHNPQDLTLEHLQFTSPSTVCQVRQTAEQPGRMTYDGVYGAGVYSRTQPRDPRGFEFVELPHGSIVHGLHLDGSLKFVNCDAATILANVSYDGVVEIAGATAPKTGFYGFLTRVATNNRHDLVVRDNNDFVAADFYAEQTDRHLLLAGGKRSAPGRVTILNAKVGTEDTQTVTINDYEGRVTLGLGQYMYQVPTRFAGTGTRPLDLVVFGNMFWKQPPEFTLSATTRLTAFANLMYENPQQSLPDQLPPAGLAAVGQALDDLAELGEWDLRLNHPR